MLFLQVKNKPRGKCKHCAFILELDADANRYYPSRLVWRVATLRIDYSGELVKLFSKSPVYHL
jgi:hypothetical protein